MLDSDLERVQNPTLMRTSLTSLVSTFRDELYEHFGCSRSHVLFLFLEIDCGEVKSLEDETVSLRTAGVLPNAKVSLNQISFFFLSVFHRFTVLFVERNVFISIIVDHSFDNILYFLSL